MIARTATLAATLALAILALAAPGSALAAEEAPCTLEPRSRCFGVKSVEASLKAGAESPHPATQAGAHPDFTFTVEFNQDPESEANASGFKDTYVAARTVRFELPPGLIGEPNSLGISQQCTVEGLLSYADPNGGCPRGSQIGVTDVSVALKGVGTLTEPVYMMTPPGGDVVARLGFIALFFPIFVDLRVRSESDYGLTVEVTDAIAASRLARVSSTTWGVPAHKSHDTERCTPVESIGGCKLSGERPPGGRPLPFMTNPTRCGVALEMRVAAANWVEPERFDSAAGAFPGITGCNKLPFGPSLTVEPTSRRAAAPTGLDMAIRLPASEGVNVLEPSQMRDIRIDLPLGMATNASSADGLGTCNADQVNLGERVNAQCPDSAKLATAEFDIPALPRRMKGAIYLREPAPGNPFRIWVVADDLGAHVKLPGQLNVDKATGQIKSVVLDSPQAPVREARLTFKSGFRAPLVNPRACGTYFTHFDFTPWSGGPDEEGDAPMAIDQGCDTGGFAPKLSAGTTDPSAGKHSPFLFTLTRQDGEQNPASLELALPPGLLATLAGVQRCEGAAAVSGQCPPGSKIGRVITAVGAGPAPLWVPQAGKRPTAFYLAGPYKGAPLSTIAVVPAQAGPFDFGDEVVRNAIFVDPTTGQATAKSDPLPQLIEGVPVSYRAIHVALDRPGFTLNPTSCKPKATEGLIASAEGALAAASSRFRAADCGNLAFKPRLFFRLFGKTNRGAHPKLRAVLKMPPGGANIARASVALPSSEFLENDHIRTICTRVQFAAEACPPGSVYGFASAKTPLLDERLKGPVYLRSSNNPLPDLVAVLRGPDSLPIETHLVGRVDSDRHGGIRNTFEIVPDAPVSEFRLIMQGGHKGLLVNSTNICAKTYRATARFTAHNGRRKTLRPAVRASCGKKKQRKKHRR